MAFLVRAGPPLFAILIVSAGRFTCGLRLEQSAAGVTSRSACFSSTSGLSRGLMAQDSTAQPYLLKRALRHRAEHCLAVMLSVTG